MFPCLDSVLASFKETETERQVVRKWLSACHPALCLHFPVSVFSVILPCMLQRKDVHCKMAVWALQREVRVDGRSFGSLTFVVLNFFKALLVTISGTV